MDQHNRPEGNPNPQSVHLHMHHVHCNCPGSIYPTYYPAATVGFRAPLPPLVPYHTPSVARPYLQHYQYTQFNLSNPYTLPIGHVTSSSTSVQYGASNSSSTDLVYSGATIREKREEGSGDTDKSNNNASDPPPPPPAEGYDAGQVTPPDKEIPATEITSEDFVKFLERRCVTAEQIAYRNRNRPCFRNIQNLCIRTRSEILKPCTTISNIHSQGIPWATKDFIYAYVRLINCWHIMRGYWDNRDGCGLGKIEKMLSPEFRSCYLEWEEQTKKMAGHLSNIFYDLDTNLNACSSGANVFNVPSQMTSTKSSSDGTLINQPPFTDSSASTTTNSSKTTTKGLIHLPVPPATLTVDQANQTVADYDTEDNNSRRYFSNNSYFPDDLASLNPNRVYMKPGNYNVPRKGSEPTSITRGIEFFDTAQNVNKAKEAWANFQMSSVKKDEVEKEPLSLSSATHINVHEWLINNNFTEYGEAKSPSAHQHQELKPYYMDSLYDSLPVMDSGSVTLLQRRKSTLPKNGKKQRRTVRSPNPYELPGGGITETGQYILDCLIKTLKGHVLGPNGEGDLEKILRKIINDEYLHINEVVRDLKYFTKMWDELDLHNTGWFGQKLNLLLTEHFGVYDFDHIKGDPKEPVGPLKPGIFFSECDQFI